MSAVGAEAATDDLVSARAVVRFLQSQGYTDAASEVHEEFSNHEAPHIRCEATLVGASSIILCVAALPGGRRLVTGSRREINIYDRAQGCVLTISDVPAIHCVAALPDGNLVTGDEDGCVKVWDSNTGQCVKTLNRSASNVECVAVLPEGLVIVGFGREDQEDESEDESVFLEDDNKLMVFAPDDDPDDNLIQTLVGHSRHVSCVAALKKGLDVYVISGSQDRTLITWNLTDSGAYPLPVLRLTGHSRQVVSLAVLPNDHAASCAEDSTCRVWDVTVGVCVRTLLGAGRLWGITLFSGQVVAGSDNGKLFFWEKGQDSLPLCSKVAHNTVRALASLPNSRFASVGFDHVVKIWVDERREMSLHVVKDLARQRLCADVAKVITKYL